MTTATKPKTKARRKSKGKTNKSAAIREFLAANPSVGPTEASAELKKQSINVSPAYISTIKSTAQKKKRKTDKRAASADSSPATEDMREAGDLMLKAVDLVVKAGAKEARALIDMAGKLVSRVSEKD